MLDIYFENIELNESDLKIINNLCQNWKAQIDKVIHSLQLTRYDDFIRYDFFAVDVSKITNSEYYDQLVACAKSNILDLNMQKYYSLFLLAKLQKQEFKTLTKLLFPQLQDLRNFKASKLIFMINQYSQRIADKDKLYHFYIHPDCSINFTTFQNVAKYVIYDDTTKENNIKQVIQKYFKYNLQHKISKLWFDLYKQKSSKRRFENSSKSAMKRKKKQ
jgi:hypothetical protein